MESYWLPRPPVWAEVKMSHHWYYKGNIKGQYRDLQCVEGTAQAANIS